MAIDKSFKALIDASLKKRVLKDPSDETSKRITRKQQMVDDLIALYFVHTTKPETKVEIFKIINGVEG